MTDVPLHAHSSVEISASESPIQYVQQNTTEGTKNSRCTSIKERKSPPKAPRTKDPKKNNNKNRSKNKNSPILQLTNSYLSQPPSQLRAASQRQAWVA